MRTWINTGIYISRCDRKLLQREIMLFQKYASGDDMVDIFKENGMISGTKHDKAT